MRVLFWILLFFPALALSATPPTITVTPHTGIVLIHGTSDHSQDAYGGYWKEDYIHDLSRLLSSPENILVIHCNFNEYMWHKDAAGCVAKQIGEFINKQSINQLVIITHSNGGNVMRWLFSHPSYDAQYIPIIKATRYIIALSPSSGGTILADLTMNGNIFERALGWLLGYQTDAVKQQRQGEIQLYNRYQLYGSKESPQLPKPFFVIAGTDVKSSPFNSDNYCNGYFLNLGLKTSKLFLDDCADGFLNCQSQIQAGQLWFFDKENLVDGKTLNHNQSRHSCFGLNKIFASLFNG